jgi:jumonji domain-containing protein 7
MDCDLHFISHCLLTKPKNDCLRKEIPKLKEHFPSGVEWAEEALGPNQPLDAINLWMGDESAVSSMHKDHYENLFYVASGEKIFTVCPPANVAFLYEHIEYSRGAFQVNDTTRQWEVSNMEEEPKVHWIAPNVTILQEENGSVLKETYPLLEHVRPMEIRVRAGEMLYLPSLWFHRVTQSCETIGINYWYEMKFDSPLWCYFSFLQQLQHCNDDGESRS